MLMGIHPIIFITLPLEYPLRIYLVKTLIEKNQLRKNHSEGKKVHYPLCVSCLIKNLTRNTQ
jgi:hypothetical protein